MLDAKFKDMKRKLRLSNDAKAVLSEILLFALGFGLMPVRFLFGTYPFGLALFGATKKSAPFVLAGAALSVVFFMGADPVYLVALLSLLALRIAASFIKKADYKKTELGKGNGKRIAEILFCEGAELRVVVSAIVTLGVGVYNVISNGYVYYDEFVLIFDTVFVSILTLKEIYPINKSKWTNKKKTYSIISQGNKKNKTKQ